MEESADESTINRQMNQQIICSRIDLANTRIAENTKQVFHALIRNARLHILLKNFDQESVK